MRNVSREHTKHARPTCCNSSNPPIRFPYMSPASETAGVHTTGTNCRNRTFKRPHPSEIVVFEDVLYQSTLPEFCSFLLYFVFLVLFPFMSLRCAVRHLAHFLDRAIRHHSCCVSHRFFCVMMLWVARSMWRRMMGLLRFGMESGAVEQLSRTTKVVGRNSIIHGRDLNSVPPDCDAALLSASPLRTVTWC